MDAFSKACDRADAMLACARSSIVAKSAANISEIITGGMGGDTQRVSYGQASEQYAANKSWVFAAIRLIASRIAGQPIHVAREPKGPSGKSVIKGLNSTDHLEPLDQHPLLDLLADPSESQTAWSLMFVTVASLQLAGRALWIYGTETSRRDSERDSLLPVPITWVESKEGNIWKIRPGGTATAIPVPSESVVHFYLPDPENPCEGALSPVQQLALAIESDNAIGECQWRAFRNGIFPRVALRVGEMQGLPGGSGSGRRPTLTVTQRKQLVETIKAAYQGVVRYDEPIILDGLIESVENLSLTPRELDFLKSGACTKARILQGLGVSPILLGEVEGANRASATVADENLVSGTVNPLISLLSLTMTEWLGPIFAGPNERLRVWIEPAKARDAEMHLKQWETGGRLGYVTPNEFRRAVLNLPDIEGGDELPIAPAVTPTAPAAKAATELEQMLDPLTNPYTLERLKDGDGRTVKTLAKTARPRRKGAGK